MPFPRLWPLQTTNTFVVELVPSSARATAPAASPLPEQLVPLLQDALDRIKSVISEVLPVSKKRTALEEAEYEDEDSPEGALERELMLQCRFIHCRYSQTLTYCCR